LIDDLYFSLLHTASLSATGFITTNAQSLNSDAAQYSQNNEIIPLRHNDIIILLHPHVSRYFTTKIVNALAINKPKS